MSAPSSNRRSAAAPFSACGWRTVVSRRAAASGTSSKPVTDSARGRHAAVGGGLITPSARTSETQTIAVGRLARSSRWPPAIRPVAVSKSGELASGDLVPFDARGLEPVAPAEHAFAVDVVVQRGGLAAVRGIVPAAHDPEAPVAERDQVLGRGAGGAAIVDVDREVRGARRVVDQHVRQPALDDRVQPRVAVAHAVDDEPVDERGAHERGVVAGDAWHQRHAELALLADRCDAVQDLDRRRVGERERERGVEHDADRPRPSARERAGDGVGPP